MFGWKAAIMKLVFHRSSLAPLTFSSSFSNLLSSPSSPPSGCEFPRPAAVFLHGRVGGRWRFEG